MAKSELRPYFLWDEDVSVAELHEALAAPDSPRRDQLLAAYPAHPVPADDACADAAVACASGWIHPSRSASVSGYRPDLGHVSSRNRTFD
jgi:hypothetical protein